jgi:hypothetical protein
VLKSYFFLAKEKVCLDVYDLAISTKRTFSQLEMA